MGQLTVAGIVTAIVMGFAIGIGFALAWRLVGAKMT